MKKFLLFFFILALVVVSISTVRVYGDENERYISAIEAYEKILGQWYQYGSMNLRFGHRYLFVEDVPVYFHNNGTYEIIDFSGEVYHGDWRIFEMNFSIWIAVNLDGESHVKTFKVIFRDGELFLHEPPIIPDSIVLDTDMFRR